MQTNQENRVAAILYIIGWGVMILGLIFGLVFGRVETGYHTEIIWPIFFTCLFAGFLCGITWIGFAEIIKLLHSIHLNLKTSSEPIMMNKNVEMKTAANKEKNVN